MHSGDSEVRRDAVTQAKIWIGAARPRTLAAAVAPVIMATAMAYEVGAFHAPSMIAALVGAILIQIGTNFANDYFDFVKGADTADRVGPARATAAGLIKPATMRLAMIITFALVFVPGSYILYRGGVPFLIIGLVSIACGVLYTGGPWPLGYLGLGDVFVLIFFGPVAVGGTYYLQALELPAIVLLVGLMPGLMSTAILTINNLRDLETDAKAGKRTLAVRFGKTFARAEYFACVALASVLLPIGICVITSDRWAILSCAIVFVLAMTSYRAIMHTEPGPQLNSILGKTGMLLGLLSVIFSVAWMI